jgi:hypothetical protein
MYLLKMELGTLNTLTKRFVYNNGMEIVCRTCFGKEDVWITLPPVVPPVTPEIISEETLHGFLTHPRNGVVRGFQFPGHDAADTPTYGIAHTGKGYKLETINGVETIVDLGDDEGVQVGTPYPLADDRATVYHFELVDGEWVAEGPQELMYGNVDWKGPKTDDPKDRKILTYKGNPSRYWPVGNFVEIPGLSSIDHSVEGLVNSYEYMTVFGDKVYENGKILVEMPWLYHPLNAIQGGWEANHQNAHVLGAAYRESDGVLLCVVKTCYNSYPRLKAAAGQDGFLVSAWHTYKNGVVYKDWLDDKAGAENQVATVPGLTLVEVPDPGRGYFVELIMSKAGDIPGGWKRLLRIETPAYCDVNWFFSEDGTKACSVMFGALHKIEITGETATHTTESLGGFKQTLQTTYEVVEEDNPGEPDPNQSGIYAEVYRVGIESGDWKTRKDETKTYTSTKSGTVTVAADYKGNTLVKMDATMSGSELYKHYRRFGYKWGATALPSGWNVGRSGDEWRTPSIAVYNVTPDKPTGYFDVNVGNVCQPTISVNVQGATATRVNSGPVVPGVAERYTLSDYVCPGAGQLAVLAVAATVTDEVSGRTATSTIEVKHPNGSWVRVIDTADSLPNVVNGDMSLLFTHVLITGSVENITPYGDYCCNPYYWAPRDCFSPEKAQPTFGYGYAYYTDTGLVYTENTFERRWEQKKTMGGYGCNGDATGALGGFVTKTVILAAQCNGQPFCSYDMEWNKRIVDEWRC